MPMPSPVKNMLESQGRSRMGGIASPQSFQYACAASGILCLIFFFVAFAASGFLPPVSPSWDAAQTVDHYRAHEKGIQAGAALMIISAMFYLPFTAAISAQMRRIPHLHYAVSALQLASGAVGTLAFTLPGLILAVANYRLTRPVEITQALNDLFWITVVMPWPIFMVQKFAFAYAIITDSRPKPLFPKAVAIINISVPVLLVPGIGVHCVMAGPLAWNGSISFWMAGFAWGVLMVIDSICLAQAVFTETEHNWICFPV